MHREALRMRRKLLGEDHPAVATSLNNLAVVLTKKQDYAGAEAMYRDALEIRRKKLESNHPSMLLLEGNLAYVVRLAGRPADAEKMLRSLIERADMNQPQSARQMPLFRHELGLCCKALGRDSEAESEWLAAYELKPAAELAAKIAGDLAGLYDSRGDAAKAAEWRTKAGEPGITTQPAK
jgi:Flp pilus assembly protein TadD